MSLVQIVAKRFIRAVTSYKENGIDKDRYHFLGWGDRTSNPRILEPEPSTALICEGEQ